MDVNVLGTILGRLMAFRDEAAAIRGLLEEDLGQGAMETRMIADVERQLATVVPALRRRLRPQ